MVFIMIGTVITALIGGLIYGFFMMPNIKNSINEQKPNTSVYFIILAAAAVIFRIAAAAVYSSASAESFLETADLIFNNGLKETYASGNMSSPGYMYILWIIGAVKTVVSNKILIRGFMAMPMIICDIAAGCIIYNAAKNKFSQNMSLMIAGFYLFNPTAVIDGTLFGQFNSIFTLALIVMVMCISNKKLIYSYIAFVAAALVNRQALMFLPVLIFAVIEQLFIEKREKKEYLKNIISFAAAVLSGFILILPFGINNFVLKYMSPLPAYTNEFINKMNLWTGITQIWNGEAAVTSVAEIIFILFTAAVSLFILIKSKNAGKYYFTSGIIAAAYIFSVKMHEMYIFPAMAMFLMAYIVTPSANMFISYWYITISQFFYELCVLWGNENITEGNKLANEQLLSHPIIAAAAYLNVIFFAFIIYNTEKLYINKEVSENNAENDRNKKAVIEKSMIFPKLNKKDIIFMIIITVIYGVIALYNIGDTSAPQSEYLFENKGDIVLLDMGQDDVFIKDMVFFFGEGSDEFESMVVKDEPKKFSVNVSNGKKFDSLMNIHWSFGFEWFGADIDKAGRYVALRADTDEVKIIEMAIIGENDEIIMPVNADQFPELFDEQQYVPEDRTYKNGFCFDEVYHARTAYDYVTGHSPYERTHPPLGKDIIAIGIKLFGMNPFGWRICGVIFGIAMIPIMYIIVKNIFKESYLAAIAAILLSADFMHFTQSRIGIIDVYVVTFIMLMYYFMYKYYSISFYDTPFKKTLIPLALSGIFMGCAISVKWNGVFASVGLAVIFFIAYIKRFREYLYAQKDINGETNGISHKYIADNYKGFAFKTIGFCCIFFIAVPLIIYCLSYIPYVNTEGMHGFASIIENQVYILKYHANDTIGMYKTFASKWYEWISVKTQILCLMDSEDGYVSKVILFGNPAVWWGGILAYIYVCYAAVKKRDKTALFIMLGYLSQIVCWIFVKRLTYIYHYFPATIFLIYAIVYFIKSMCSKYSSVMIGKIPVIKSAAVIYTVIAVMLFAMFYPVISWTKVDKKYTENWLEWFETWRNK